jgi:hypothetical protein
LGTVELGEVTPEGGGASEVEEASGADSSQILPKGQKGQTSETRTKEQNESKKGDMRAKGKPKAKG